MPNPWNDGYPLGGNYWGDYTDVDVDQGLEQDVSGSDGISANSYTIDVNNENHYPLTNTWGSDPIHKINVSIFNLET